jgi:hypothetical protein
MTAGIFARVPTVAAIVVVALLATATLTLAATSNTPTPVQATAEPIAQPTLVVPDVRRQAYVFAKGALEQAGFAWKVTGSVQGYAANVVAVQSPAPGTHVIANGAPIISLQLSRNSAYKQEGLPENASPYKGSPVKLLAAKSAVARVTASAPAAKPATKKKRKTATAPKVAAPVGRKPAFAAPNAPKEPLDEIALTARAKQLGTWLESHKTRTPRNVNHWLYQHNWIVTGAGFGWHDGSEALRVLIQVDERVQKLWGVGVKSEQVARRALAEVKARAQ